LRGEEKRGGGGVWPKTSVDLGGYNNWVNRGINWALRRGGTDEDKQGRKCCLEKIAKSKGKKKMGDPIGGGATEACGTLKSAVHGKRGVWEGRRKRGGDRDWEGKKREIDIRSWAEKLRQSCFIRTRGGYQGRGEKKK